MTTPPAPRLAFTALVHAHAPGAVPDPDTLDPAEAEGNLNAAFGVFLSSPGRPLASLFHHSPYNRHAILTAVGVLRLREGPRTDAAERLGMAKLLGPGLPAWGG